MCKKTLISLTCALALFGCDEKESADTAPAKDTADKTPSKDEGDKTTKTAASKTVDGKGADKSEPAKPAVPELAVGAMPFEFPIVEETDAKAGDKVFSVNMKLVRNGLKKGDKTFSTQYLHATMVEPGAKASKVKFVSADDIPNSAIVRIPPDVAVKKGDMVAGKWAVNMTRGIVVDAKDPKAPKVRFVGLGHDNPAKGPDGKTGIGQFAFPQKAGEFMAISKPYDPATACAVKIGGKYKLLTVFRAVGDRVMGTQFTQFTSVPKADCIALPIKPAYKKGQKVWAAWVGTMSEGTITKVDIGRYQVKFDAAGKGEKMVSFGEVIDKLP